MDAAGAADREVWAGVRPEGFVPCPDGPLACRMERVEVMGRDTSIISSHSACTQPVIRSIVSSESAAALRSGQPAETLVRFALKPDKVFLFDRDTEARIRLRPAGSVPASERSAR